MPGLPDFFVVSAGQVGPPGPAGLTLLATVPDLSVASFHDFVFPSVPNSTHRGYKLRFRIGDGAASMPLFFRFLDANQLPSVTESSFVGSYIGGGAGIGVGAGALDSGGTRLGGFVYASPVYGEIDVHECGNTLATWDFRLVARQEHSGNFLTMLGGRYNSDLSGSSPFVYNRMRFLTTGTFPSGVAYLYGV